MPITLIFHFFRFRFAFFIIDIEGFSLLIFSIISAFRHYFHAAIFIHIDTAFDYFHFRCHITPPFHFRQLIIFISADYYILRHFYFILRFSVSMITAAIDADYYADIRFHY
jgi:hypothetical protein